MDTPTILVVDDDPGIAALIETILKKEGYNTVKALDGRSALDIFDDLRPDLVLLDLAMPNMNGLQVLAEIRERDRAAKRHTKVVLLTAHIGSYFSSSDWHEQADGYVAKPVTITKLRAELRGYFSDNP
jgi:CheY-like chemotaxis protein